MKLRAQITIDIMVDDFIEAADHQRRVKILAETVRREYAQAVLDFRQRRDRPQALAASASAVARRTQHYTGRMREYE